MTRSLRDYLTESETWAHCPREGDEFDIELAPDEIVESRVLESDGQTIVLEATDEIISVLEQRGMLSERIGRYGAVGSNRAMGFSVAEGLSDIDIERQDWERMSPAEFRRAHGKSKEQWQADYDRMFNRLQGQTRKAMQRTEKKDPDYCDACDRPNNRCVCEDISEGFLGDREYNRVMPFVKRIAGEVSDYDRDEFGEELWSLLDQKYGSKFAQSVLVDLDVYWDTYTELTGQQDVQEDQSVNRMMELAGCQTDRESEIDEGTDNGRDTVEFDIPTFIRMLEYAREDAKDDMDLHDVAEKAIELSQDGQPLTMADYDAIVGGPETVQEGMMSEVDIELHDIASSEDEEELIAALSGSRGKSVALVLDQMMANLADELSAQGDEEIVDDDDRMIELLMDKLSQEYGDPDLDPAEPMSEAKYQGRKVPLGKPMRGDVKKFKVYVKDPKTGNVKKVNFGHGGTSAKRAGQKTMKIKKSNPARRKSFRARHRCDTAKDRTTARYWSCRAW